MRDCQDGRTTRRANAEAGSESVSDSTKVAFKGNPIAMAQTPRSCPPEYEIPRQPPSRDRGMIGLPPASEPIHLSMRKSMSE